MEVKIGDVGRTKGLEFMKRTPVQLLNMGVDGSCLQVVLLPGGPGHMSQVEGRNRVKINGFNCLNAPHSPGEGPASPSPDPDTCQTVVGKNGLKIHRKPPGRLLTSPNVSARCGFWRRLLMLNGSLKSAFYETTTTPLSVYRHPEALSAVH